MTFPAGQQITLVTRADTGQRDSDGNVVFTETSTVVRGAFAPAGSTELIQGQDIVITQPTVYLPYSAQVNTLSAVIVAGVKYEVDGTPNVWASPWTGRQAGIEVKLLEVSG